MSWYFVYQQQARGPIEAEDLADLFDEGAVQNETLVWRPGVAEWKPLTHYDELVQAVRNKPSKKRKVEQTETVDVTPWLATVSDDARRDILWTSIMKLQDELLIDNEDARDDMLSAFIVNCPHMDDDPEKYEFSDDFFMDMVMEVEGKDELWGYIKQEEQAITSLLQAAADMDEEIRDTIKGLHILGKLEAALKSGSTQHALEVLHQQEGAMAVRDTRGNTALHLITQAGAVAVLQALAEQRQLGARLVNVANNSGDTPLHIATRAGNTDMATSLLQAGASVGQQNKDTSKYADGSWVVKDRSTNFSIPLPELDRTPLHIAAEAGDAETLQLLLEFLPENSGKRRNMLETRSTEGATALMLAVEAAEEDAAAALIAAGAEVAHADVAGAGRTLLHQACSQGSTEVLKLLLGTGKLDVNQADDSGWAPLHLATRRGSVPCVQLLLEAGADAALQNAQGKTALQIAEVNKRSKVMELLLQHAGGKAGV